MFGLFPKRQTATKSGLSVSSKTGFWVGCVVIASTVVGCATRPMVSPEVNAARSELARLESNLVSRRSQLPNVAQAPSSVDAVPAISQSATQTTPAARCDGICVTAQAICGYSRRICTLAQQIADEPSQRSCKNAERECQDASNQCASCR